MSTLSLRPEDAVRREFIRVLAQIKRRQIAAACSTATTDSPADKHDQQKAVSLCQHTPATRA